MKVTGTADPSSQQPLDVAAATPSVATAPKADFTAPPPTTDTVTPPPPASNDQTPTPNPTPVNPATAPIDTAGDVPDGQPPEASPGPAPSVGYMGMARQAASVTSTSSQIQDLEKELGVTDPNGKDLTPSGQDARAQLHQAQVQKHQDIIDQAKNPPIPPPPPAPGEKLTPDQQLKKDMADAPINQVVGGAADAIQNIANAGINFMGWVDQHLPNIIDGAKFDPAAHQLDFADKFAPPKNNTEKLIRGVSQFLIPYLGEAKIIKAAGLAKGFLATNALAGAATNFLAFKGDQERVSNLVQNIPELSNPVTQYLMSKPGDSDAEGRFKNVLEGMGLGVAAGTVGEGLFTGFKYLKGKVTATEAIQMVDDVKAGVSPKAVPKADANIDGAVGGELPKIDANLAGQKAKPLPGEMSVADATKPADVSGKGGGAYVNLERVNASPDVLSIMKNISENDKAALEANIPISNQAIIRGQPITPLEDLFAKKSGDLLNEQELYSARVHLASAATATNKLAQQALVTGAEADKVGVMHALEAARQINFLVTEGKARPAQILNSLKMRVEGADNISGWLRVQGEANVDQMITHLSTMGPEAIGQATNKTYGQKVGDAVFEAYMNNLLWNPSTHMVNNSSNFSVSALAAMERGVAPYVDQAMGVIGKSKAVNVSTAEARQVMKTHAELSAIDTTNLNWGELGQHKAALTEAEKAVQRLTNSSVVPGEAMAGVRGGANAFAEQTMNEVLSKFSAFKDGLHMLWGSANKEGTTLTKLAAKDGDMLHNPFSKMEEMPPSLTAANLLPQGAQDGALGTGVDILGGIHRLPSEGLAWADNFWKGVNYRQEVQSLGYRLGVKQGFNGEELSKYVSDFTARPPDFIKSMAEKRALINTFTNPLDDELSKHISKLIETRDAFGVQLWINPLKFVVPFKRTMLNIQKFTIARTPLALISNNYSEALKAGGAEAQMARTQMALGTSIMGTASLLAGSGYITGSGPTDPKARKALMDQGWKPYAAHIGDQYIDLKRFDFGGILAAGADIAEIAPHIGTHVTVDDAQQIGGLAAMTALHIATPEQLTDNLGTLFEAIKTGNPSKLISDVVSKIPPAIGAANDIRKMTDPLKRITKPEKNDPQPFLSEVLNKIKNQIPTYSNTLSPSLNIWGKPISYPSGLGEQAASPFIGSKFDGKDPVINELSRLNLAAPRLRTGPANAPHLEITLPPDTFRYSGGAVDLDHETRNRLITLSAGADPSVAPNGQSLHDAMAEMIKNNYPQIGLDKLKTDPRKIIELKQLVTKYHHMAKQQLLREKPSLIDDLIHSQKAIQQSINGGE